MLLKIETGRYKRLTEIDDLVAGTIITPTLRGHDDIISFLAENFHIREERARENVPFNPSIFRFDSTRVYFTLDLSDHTNGDPIASKIICELQIRTALEHAWIAALHDLVYKAEQLDWQKERLSAQLKAELETLDLVLYNFDEVAARIPKRRWDRFDELNAIVGIIEELKEEQHLPTEIIPKNLKRVAENI